MKLVYHRLAVRDVREALDYYEREAGSHLADRFFREFLATIGRIQANPLQFPPVADNRLRRANLNTFPSRPSA